MHYYIVDCFAEEKYQGNQLLVVIPDRMLSDEEQQKIAKEINFSETSFVLSGKNDDGGYDVRIWTPTVGEVPFAGHPSIGTAFVIGNYLEKGAVEVRLNLKVGQIPVKNENGIWTMSQKPPVFGPDIPKEEIAAVFGLDQEDIRSDYPVGWASTGLESVLIPLSSREALSKAATDREAFRSYINRYPQCCCSHLFFVDMGDGTFHARNLMEDFNEDPATGSANGDLAAYLVKNGYFKSSSASYTVVQGEDMGRRSVLDVNVSLLDGVWSIEVGGGCFLVAEGEWK